MEQNAGYTIVASECYHTQEGGAEECVLLGRRPGDAPGAKWVTWEALRHPEGHLDCFWGHYFTTKEDALFDYHSRLLHHYCDHLNPNT